MIIEFSVKNFRSIKKMQTISFVATGLKSSEKYAEVDKNNIVEADDMRLFKTLGIYGANASGKSNVIKALDLFVKTITKEPSPDSNLGELCDPFLFQENAEETESFFQIVMIIDGVKYRYGLTVKRNNFKKNGLKTSKSKEIITNEWLYGKKEKNMRVLFQRENKVVTSSNLDNKERIPTALPYGHSLYLTHAAAFDEEGECQKVRNHLFMNFGSNFSFTNEEFRAITLDNMLLHSIHPYLQFFTKFGLKYSHIHLEIDEDDFELENFPQEKIFLVKEFKNKYGDTIKRMLNLKNNESAGTQKLFDLAGILLTMFNSSTPIFLSLDEIDSNFHPSLLIKLIGLFNDSKINKSNSQLLFTSHDTNLMSPTIMRRDQFYFTEKKEDESTRLYSLADLKGIRNDADFAKQYLAGYYGAVPVLEDYTLAITNSLNDE